MKRICLMIVILLLAYRPGLAETNFNARLKLPQKDTILLTVFLKHDQSMNNVERGKKLDAARFKKMFPPVGVEIVNHYVMMGIGQVIVMRLPPDMLRIVNRAIEHGAWGSFKTEFYITYDLREARKAAEAPK